MTSTVGLPRQAGARRPHRRAPGRRSRLLLVPPAAAVVCVIGLSARLWLPVDDPVRTSPGDVLAAVAVLLVDVLVPGLVAGLVLTTARFWPRGMPVTAATSIFVSAAVIGEVVIALAAGGSTTPLDRTLVPPELALALLPFVAASVLVHRARS